MLITIPPKYPINPPVFCFKTPVFHPNIHGHTGEVGLENLLHSQAVNGVVCLCAKFWYAISVVFFLFAVSPIGLP